MHGYCIEPSMDLPLNYHDTIMACLIHIIICIMLLCDNFQPIPANVFIVAACNPHRSNSLASHKSWVRGTYYVHPLHPTLKFLMWDYGSLDKHQEKAYTIAKMEMINSTMSKSDVSSSCLHACMLFSISACFHAAYSSYKSHRR